MGATIPPHAGLPALGSLHHMVGSAQQQGLWVGGVRPKIRGPVVHLGSKPPAPGAASPCAVCPKGLPERGQLQRVVSNLARTSADSQLASIFLWGGRGHFELPCARLNEPSSSTTFR